MKSWVTKVIIAVVLAGLAGGAALWYRDGGEKRPSYRTAAVKRTDLLSTIDATGTLEPEEVIDVGAQVAGLILGFGKDANGKTIDYGSVVEEGTVLAQIDDSLYKADVATATAQLDQANAGVQRAQADLAQMQAKLVQAQNDWERAQKLGSSEALAQAAYDQYRAAYETAKANVAVGQASIEQAKGAVGSAEASLFRAKRNLGYCTIKSPVKGVIIDRRVNTGQTVVSSLNAPSLFLIAKDLKHMQVWVSVNEADIGSIYPGQPVTFTVDAFGGETFHGEVGKVRLNAMMTQNVVTYTVEVVTDNSSGRLLPYLTANVKFEVNRRDNVLTVPNVALRWMPGSEQIAPDARAEMEASPTSAPSEEGGRSRLRGAGSAPATEPTGGRGGRAGSQGARMGRGTLWVSDGNYVRPIRVRTGITDGIDTEVQGDQLQEGTQVIVGEVVAQQSSGATPGQFGGGSPFAPQIRRGGGGGGAGGGAGRGGR